MKRERTREKESERELALQNALRSRNFGNGTQFNYLRMSERDRETQKPVLRGDLDNEIIILLVCPCV